MSYLLFVYLLLQWKRFSNHPLSLLIIFTNPSARAGYDTRSIFKRNLTGLNSEFSFWTSCLTKAEEPSLPYYLPIAGERIIGFIPFPRVLVLCKMHSVSSRIWTRAAVSISYDDNHYTTCTSSQFANNIIFHGVVVNSLFLFLFFSFCFLFFFFFVHNENCNKLLQQRTNCVGEGGSR